MRLGEIEFAIIPSEECGVEELYSDDIPRLLPFLRLDMYYVVVIAVKQAGLSFSI